MEDAGIGLPAAGERGEVWPHLLHDICRDGEGLQRRVPGTITWTGKLYIGSRARSGSGLILRVDRRMQAFS